MLSCIPEDHLHFGVFLALQSEMFSFFPERFCFYDGDAFEEEERLTVPDTKRAKSIDHIKTFLFHISRIDTTLDTECFFRKISSSIFFEEFLPDLLLEICELRLFDRESCGLSMTTIPDKIFTTLIEKLDQVAPFWRATGGDEIGFLFCHCEEIFLFL